MYGGYYLGQLYLGISGLPSSGTLTVQSSSHQLSSDNLTLTQKHTLVINSAAHTLVSDNITITQKHQLSIANTIHALTSDNIVLTQKHVLALNNALHGLTSSNISLTQKHTIVVNNTSHSLSSDNTVLVEHKTLVVQDTLHGHTVDGNLPIVVHFYLVVDNATHSHSADNIVLTQKQLLAVGNAVHSIVSDNLNGLVNLQPYGMGGGFGAIDGFGLAEFGSINMLLPLNWLILNLDSYISLQDDFDSLTQKHYLSPDDANHNLFSTTTMDLVQIYYREGGVYIRDEGSSGTHGAEYVPGTGTLPNNSAKQGQFNSILVEINGSLVRNGNYNGSYEIDEQNTGQLTNKNGNSGAFLPANDIATGSYIKQTTPQGDYEVT